MLYSKFFTIFIKFFDQFYNYEFNEEERRDIIKLTKGVAELYGYKIE